MGIGTSMFTHGDAIFDPFTYIVFLGGRENIPNLFIWCFVIKLIAEGIAFYLYLKHFELNPYAIVIASIFYSFSGYSLIMGSNLALGTILVYTPIVFLGIEKMIDEKKVVLLGIGLFFTCIYSYYFFYILGVLSGVYLCFRLVQKKRNPIKYLFGLLIVGIVVMLLSSFALLPQLILTLRSARVSGNSDVIVNSTLIIPQWRALATMIARSVCNPVLGDANTGTYIGYALNDVLDYFQMACFSGSMLIVLLYHYMRNEPRKIKTIMFCFLLCCIAISVPFFSFMCNAFTTINARWMFLFSIIYSLAMGFSIDSIIRNGGLKLKYVIEGTILNISIFLLSVLPLYKIADNSKARLISNGMKPFCFFVTINFLFITIAWIQSSICHKIVKKYMLSFFATVLVLSDIAYNYFQWFGTEYAVCEYSEVNRVNYMDTSADIISDIMEQDTQFYRIHKNFDSVYGNNNIASENDAMVQKYYGLKSYNSVNNVNYINFLQGVGIYVALPLNLDYYKNSGVLPNEIVGPDLNYIHGVYNDRYLMNYLGVKYYLKKEQEDSFSQFLEDDQGLSYEKLYEKNGISVYKNPEAYPLAFVNERIISDDEFAKLSNEEKRLALLFYTVVDKQYENEKDIVLDATQIFKSATNKQKAFKMMNFSNDEITFEIDAGEKGGYLSFTIPYDDNWTLRIDGEQVDIEKINISFLGAQIAKGTHLVELKYIPREFYAGIIILGGTITVIIITVIANKIKRRDNKKS